MSISSMPRSKFWSRGSGVVRKRSVSIKDTGVAKAETNAYSGWCVCHGKEHHDKCPGVQTMSWGTNTCPCKCHKTKKTRKKA